MVSNSAAGSVGWKKGANWEGGRSRPGRWKKIEKCDSEKGKRNYAGREKHPPHEYKEQEATLVSAAVKLSLCSTKKVPTRVHTRRALPSTVTNSHQEPVPGQACNPPDPHRYLFLFCLVRECYGTQY